MATAPDQIRERSAHETEAGRALPASWWEGLCCWLATTLKGMEMTLQRRREADGEWEVECLPHPLESITTHQTPNGVQIIWIGASIDGKTRVFEFAGANSITLFKDPAGFPARVEIRNEEEQLLLCFTGPIEPQTRQTSNSWGE
jgi:hypothetical protein